MRTDPSFNDTLTSPSRPKPVALSCTIGGLTVEERIRSINRGVEWRTSMHFQIVWWHSPPSGRCITDGRDNRRVGLRTEISRLTKGDTAMANNRYQYTTPMAIGSAIAAFVYGIVRLLPDRQGFLVCGLLLIPPAVMFVFGVIKNRLLPWIRKRRRR